MSTLAANHATIINEQVARINAATTHGTLDQATVNDACAKLAALTNSEPKPVLGASRDPNSPDANYPNQQDGRQGGVNPTTAPNYPGDPTPRDQEAARNQEARNQEARNQGTARRADRASDR